MTVTANSGVHHAKVPHQAITSGKGWSQEQLATIAGLSTRTVQRIENGEQASTETLNAIAAALGVQVSDLNAQPQQAMEEETPDEQRIRRRSRQKANC